MVNINIFSDFRFGHNFFASYSSDNIFMRATADFWQKDMEGAQEKTDHGHLLPDGNFIFWWLDGPIRKMVLTTNYGKQMQQGYLAAAELWENPETWRTITNAFYYIENFQPRQG